MNQLGMSDGFRNPYRFSFDSRGEHALLAGDVGHAVMEEVDVVRRAGNYGWPLREGTTCFNSSNWTQRPSLQVDSTLRGNQNAPRDVYRTKPGNASGSPETLQAGTGR